MTKLRDKVMTTNTKFSNLTMTVTVISKFKVIQPINYNQFWQKFKQNIKKE